MTGRERFRETLRYGRPDHVPYLEEGLREGVLARWHEQGLPAEADPAELFHIDRRERIELNLGPLPQVRRWPKTCRGLASLRRRLDPRDPRRLPADWAHRVRAWRRRDHILELPIHHGFFLTLGVGDWRRLTEVLYLLSDAPALVRETMHLFGELSAAVAERVLDEVDVDFVSFSEPIAGSHGPLLSPRHYREFVLSSYRPVLGVLQRRGVEVVCLITYANPRVLVSAALDAGFNCLWACETDPHAMDYRELRREFGRELRLIGGIDLDTLLLDQAAIRAEMTSKLPPLLAEGGYIPLADGRVRENVPFENYRFYRRLLEELTRT